MNRVKSFSDIYKLSRAAAEQWITLHQYAIAERGHFTIALSGGNTPESLYALMATEPYAARMDWDKVHVFWGDERCVAPTHTESNYFLANEALLKHVPLPSENIHRIQGEHKPAEAAFAYEDDLREFFGEMPRFDLVLLGLGDDGHTASLFPDTDALHEENRWAVPNFVDRLRAWRVTLTAPVINHARHITFLVTGANKADAMRKALAEDTPPTEVPARLIQPTNGELVWLIDDELKSLL